MGLHTWFLKSKSLWEKELELELKLIEHEDSEIYLDELEFLATYNECNQIHEENRTNYHDLFRTNKRNGDGTYTDDVIFSEEECHEWLKENEHSEVDYKRLKQFWKEYPNGVIEFG